MDSAQIPNRRIAVFGAYGHTGRFVVSELLERGFTPILSGRDEAKLKDFGRAHPTLELRAASADDPASLDRALAGAAAVINCAGPFLDTSAPVIDAALRASIHYFDVAAEQPAVLAVFDRYAGAALPTGVVIAPSMAFYGALGDLLATAAMGDWDAADEITIATALDSWKPTRGTRSTGERNPGQHYVFSKNKLERAEPPAPREWDFPPPFGKQSVVGLALAESITIPRHLRTPEVRVYINLAPITDIRNPKTPGPTAADESGRSSQIFAMESVVRKGNTERRAAVSGQDIYFVTAPIVVEAAERVLSGRAKASGVVAAGEAFAAEDFLRALSPRHLLVKVR
jgi:short subunit dehydrogenase-like uncharacterized protein